MTNERYTVMISIDWSDNAKMNLPIGHVWISGGDLDNDWVEFRGGRDCAWWSAKKVGDFIGILLVLDERRENAIVFPEKLSVWLYCKWLGFAWLSSTCRVGMVTMIGFY